MQRSGDGTPVADKDEFILAPYDGDASSALDGWRGNVGSLVSIDPDTPMPEARQADDGPALVLISWNVWIGHGRLRELVTRVRNGDFLAQGAVPDAPLVVLAQEVYREDQSIAPGKTRHSGSISRAKAGRQREDVTETARSLGMHLRYAPSMRNGMLQSDRGNAVLSSLPLYDARAIELPHVHQRRVAVAATVRLGGSALQLVSAHLDPRGPLGYQVLGMAGRALQAKHLLAALRGDSTMQSTAHSTVLGADLNLAGGRREMAWRFLQSAGFTEGVPSRPPSWRHTFHGVPRVLIDYLLFRDPAGMIAQAPVVRLDEHPQDRGPLVFGSDHHPLLAAIHLTHLADQNA